MPESELKWLVKLFFVVKTTPTIVGQYLLYFQVDFYNFYLQKVLFQYFLALKFVKLMYFTTWFDFEEVIIVLQLHKFIEYKNYLGRIFAFSKSFLFSQKIYKKGQRTIGNFWKYGVEDSNIWIFTLHFPGFPRSQTLMIAGISKNWNRISKKCHLKRKIGTRYFTHVALMQ